MITTLHFHCSGHWCHPWSGIEDPSAHCGKKVKIKVVSCEWIKVIQHTYTTETYLTTRKKEILLFGTTWMDLEGIMLSEMSQIEKDKYCMISLIYRI